jgi:hypothetical protein
MTKTAATRIGPFNGDGSIAWPLKDTDTVGIAYASLEGGHIGLRRAGDSAPLPALRSKAQRLSDRRDDPGRESGAHRQDVGDLCWAHPPGSAREQGVVSTCVSLVVLRSASAEEAAAINR